jgi:hypothetical protein
VSEDEGLEALYDDFTKEAYDFALKAGEKGIRTTVVFVIENPLTGSHTRGYTGAGMNIFESIGALHATIKELERADSPCTCGDDDE